MTMITLTLQKKNPSITCTFSKFPFTPVPLCKLTHTSHQCRNTTTKKSLNKYAS